MISGRGLGHTGGTLDKLESIPGYLTTPDPERLRAARSRAPAARSSARPASWRPADRRLYAIRDATGTVESIPLIVASILSKKLAAGLDALVMDVKTGSGAFMAGHDAARELAEALVDVADGAGLPCRRADHRHGPGAGAHGRQRARGARVDRPPHRRRARPAPASRSRSRCAASCSRSAASTRPRDARRSALAGGAAAERFAAMVAALGGPADLLERPGRHLPAAPRDRGRSLPERPGSWSGHRRPRRRPRRHRPRRRPPPRGRRDRPRRRPERDRRARRARSARDRPLAIVHARATRAPRRRPPRCAPRTRSATRLRPSGRSCWSAGSGVTMVPKAELHVHLEGTAPPHLVRRLAERNGLRGPRGRLRHPDRFAWLDFLDFLQTYDLAASVIRTARGLPRHHATSTWSAARARARSTSS